MPARRIPVLTLLSLLVLPYLLVACSPSATPENQASIERIAGPTMGTQYHISWVRKPELTASTKQLQQQIDQRLVVINQVMSTYDAQSELSQINQQSAQQSQPQSFSLSADLAEVLELSLGLYRDSGGLFDVTVGPLVNLWGFGPDPMRDQAPADDAIQQALANSGADALTLSGQQLQVAASRYIDLSAIAKGWAVDEVAELLRQQGIDSYLVEIGGEIQAHGLKPNQQPWRIAIERPQDLAAPGATRPQLIIPLRERAIATSGDYRNYFEQNGVRYSHTINPADGRPITHTLASVSVIHESAAVADGWATALNVAGPEQALALAEQYNLAVYLIERQGDGFQQRTSSRFRAWFADELK